MRKSAGENMKVKEIEERLKIWRNVIEMKSKRRSEKQPYIIAKS